MNWLMERILALYRPHTHVFHRARKGQDKNYTHCLCSAKREVKRRKTEKAA